MTEEKKSPNFVYFKDAAVRLGCTNIEELSDIQIWKFVMAKQGKEWDII